MVPKYSFPYEKINFERIDINRSKPTIVFLHDSLGCVELWRKFPLELGEITNCNVLMYDRQGYGNSCSFTYSERDTGYMELEADILVGLLDYWKLDKVILFGHSDGGSIALIAAGKYPARFHSIITEGAHIFVEDITLQGITEAVKAYHSTNLKDRLTKYHGDKTADLFWAWAKTWHTPKFKLWNIEKFLPLITCPALIIQGEEDEYGSLNQVYRSISGIGNNARSLILKNTKHSPHKESKKEVLHEVSLFFDSIKEELK